MRRTKLRIACLSLGLLCLAAAPPLLAPNRTADRLLGNSPDHVMELFGVPDKVSVSAALLVFEYADKADKPARFAFHSDVCVATPAAGFAPAKVTRPPADRPFLGQKVNTAVMRAGNPAKWTVGTMVATLHHDDGTDVSLYHGRVVGVQ